MLLDNNLALLLDAIEGGAIAVFSLFPPLVTGCLPRVGSAVRGVTEGLDEMGLADARTGRARVFFERASPPLVTLFLSEVACRVCDRGFFGAGPVSSADDNGRGGTPITGTREPRNGARMEFSG